MPGRGGGISGTEPGLKLEFESPAGEGLRGFLLGSSYPQMARITQMTEDGG